MLSFRIHKSGTLFIILAGALLFSNSACTMTVHALVQDESGNPLQNAVVYAAAAQQSGVKTLPSTENGAELGKRVSIDLKNQKLIPVVLPVRIGTAVSFWNRDTIQHRIYSISPAKQFELTIDKGESSAAVVFDKPGVVVMGSAINDLMIGYVYVLKTPWFARTGTDGKADLRDLPEGTYDVRVWHPGMKCTPEATTKRVVPSSQGEISAKFAIPLQAAQNPEPKPGPAPLPAAGGK